MRDDMVRRLFDLAQERYRIFLRRREGQDTPWTGDPILQQYRFCNVFREDDRVTRWFRDNVREPNRDSEDIVFMCALFRYINRIETAEALLETNLFEVWDEQRFLDTVAPLSPIVGAAYIVKTPDGMHKAAGIVELLRPIHEERRALFEEFRDLGCLQDAHAALCGYPWVGPFMAYEIVTDLRHTTALDHAADKFTWANPGPGATRGLKRLRDGEITGSPLRTTEAQDMMQEILRLSTREENWESEWPQWEMREVEHLLCEFDKYERTRLGEGRPKQHFRVTA